jgi:hypothetical protein
MPTLAWRVKCFKVCCRLKQKWSFSSWRKQCFIRHITLRRPHRIVKGDYLLRHICLSVCPHGTTRIPQNGFSWDSIFEDFFKTACPENSGFVKMWQEKRVNRMNNSARSIWYLAEFFLECEMLQKKYLEKNLNTRFMPKRKIASFIRLTWEKKLRCSQRSHRWQ